MPAENLEDESLAKNPNLELSQWKFMLTTDQFKDNIGIRDNLMTVITDNNMSPFYQEVCDLLRQ
jgi:26S proteasome regulatory subunit N7